MRNSNDAVTSCLYVLVAVTAVAVNGKPYQTCLQPENNYAKTIYDQYYNSNMQRSSAPIQFAAETVPAVPFADYDVASSRSGRSNEPGLKLDESVPTDVASIPPYMHHHQPLIGHHFGIAQSTVAKPSIPCTRSEYTNGNDTLSATAVEKLAMYYEQLKAQQDTLARHQLQQLAYEQQQRRQQEYMALQQQIQQHYYKQQQHELNMLEHLRKNPTYAGKFASFIDQKRVEPGNGTAVPVPVPSVKVPLNEREQVIANHKTDKDAVVEYGCDSAVIDKRLEARQAANSRIIAKDLDASEDPAEILRPTLEDDQTPPVLAKVYSMVTE